MLRVDGLRHAQHVLDRHGHDVRRLEGHHLPPLLVGDRAHGGAAEARREEPVVARRLAAALQRIYGHEVHLNVQLDPTLVGGIRVEIGDDVIDGTVSTRLDDARRKLAG